MPIRSTSEDAEDDDHAGDEADQERRPRRDERARRGDRDEGGDRAVEHHRDVRLLDHQPRGDERSEHARRRGDVGVQRDVGEEAEAAEVDRQGRARVEAEPAEPEDDHAERRVGHVVTGNRVRLAVGVELADPRAEQQRPGERREGALVVDDGRSGEVLHALREQPAVGRPDPVRDDRVDQGERQAEDDVDVELRPLGHRAPDDRERHAAEHDLEQVAGGARDLAEPGERRLADRHQVRGCWGRSPSRRRGRCRRRRTRSRSRRGSRPATPARRSGRSWPRCGRRSSSGSGPPRGTRSRPA